MDGNGGIDPVTKQFIIFSGIIALIIAGAINFFFVELARNSFASFAYGFPINLAGTTGIGSFLARLIDTIVNAAILLPMVYYIVKYLQTRVRI